MMNLEWLHANIGDMADDLSSDDMERLRQAIEKIVAEAERRGQMKACDGILRALSDSRRDVQCICAVKSPTCGCVNDDYNEALDDIEKFINELKSL